jgi:hypothetical protein
MQEQLQLSKTIFITEPVYAADGTASWKIVSDKNHLASRQVGREGSIRDVKLLRSYGVLDDKGKEKPYDMTDEEGIAEKSRIDEDAERATARIAAQLRLEKEQKAALAAKAAETPAEASTEEPAPTPVAMTTANSVKASK